MANPIKIGNNILCDGIYKSGAVFLLSNKADIIFSKDYSKNTRKEKISPELIFSFLAHLSISTITFNDSFASATNLNPS